MPNPKKPPTMPIRIDKQFVKEINREAKRSNKTARAVIGEAWCFYLSSIGEVENVTRRKPAESN